RRQLRPARGPARARGGDPAGGRGRGLPGARPGADHGFDGARTAAVHGALRAQLATLAGAQARERSWRRSLARKRALFPEHLELDDRVLRLRMRELTEWLVLRHTDFGSLDAYFDRYSIAGDRLA